MINSGSRSYTVFIFIVLGAITATMRNILQIFRQFDLFSVILEQAAKQRFWYRLNV